MKVVLVGLYDDNGVPQPLPGGRPSPSPSALGLLGKDEGVLLDEKGVNPAAIAGAAKPAKGKKAKELAKPGGDAVTTLEPGHSALFQVKRGRALPFDCNQP